jgi:alpha-mannosidase
MTHTLTIVSHTHWDREWYQPFQEYRIRLVQLVDRLLDLLAQDPGYRHFTLDGQTILLEDYLEIRPAREQTLKQYIQRGRLLAGPWYILPDEFLVSPEATIRNLMLGDRVSRRFGPKMAVGYVPDSFGHISQLPQILRGFGLGAAVLWRGVGEAPNEFQWAAPDGSQVLAIHLREGYGNAAWLPDDAEGLAEHLARLADRLAPHATTPHLLAMNGTDHLEPMAGLPARLADAGARLPELEIRQGTLPQFVAAVRAAQPELEIRQGEMRWPGRANLLPGVFSTRIWIKQRNAHCETLLEKWAEPFSALASAYGLETPARDLSALCWQAWRHLIRNHPHDSICGCSVDAVHKEMDVRFDWVEQIGEEVTRQSLQAIAAAVDTKASEGVPLVVFNPTAGPRTDLVTVRVPFPGDVDAVELTTPDGRPLPCDIVERVPASSRHLDLDRGELRAALARATGDTVGEDGLQSVRASTVGDLALIEVALAPLPPASGALEAARAQVEVLLADESIQRFRLEISRYAELEVRTVAPEVPGLGYLALAARPAPGQPDPGPPPDRPRLENEFFVVEPDLSNGTLTVTDRRTGLTFPRLHRLVDGGDRGDEYNYCPPEHDRLVSAPETPPTIRLLESSPVRQTLEIAQVYHIPAGLASDRTRRSHSLVPLPVTTRVSLSPGVPRIEFTTTLLNQAQDHRLRLRFPAPLVTETAHAEGHFDVVSRSLALPGVGPAWREQPVPTSHQRTFVDVNDGQAGLLVANRGLPEYEVIPQAGGVTVALTLLRCVGWLSRDDLSCREGLAGPAYPTPGAQCPGEHTFAYALVPHAGGWEAAMAQAHAFAAPLRGVATSRSPGSLPPRLSFLRAEPSGFVLTAVKQAEEGDGLIVRGYNVTANPQEVRLHLDRAWRRAARVGLDEGVHGELALEGHSVRFVAGPKEIVTVWFEA